MITRRRLISAGSALASAFGLIGESPANAAAVPWADLADSISGTIVLPGDPGYLGLATPAALNYLQVSPRAVCLPHSAEDITTIIAFAREQRIGLRVRGGGHSYAGYSTTDGIQLDMSGMRGCSYDAGTETVDMQGGVRGIDAASTLERTKRWIPAGNCPGVGIAGFVQGGGFGFYMGEAGLGCDNLVEAELVTASGTTVIASEQGAPDLLWALRGGGGGNFGVISRLRLRTFTTERPSSVCLVIWRGTPPSLLIARLRDMIEGTGDELTWHFTCDATSPYNLAGSSLPQVTLLCHGFTDATRIVRALAPVVAAHPPCTVGGPRSALLGISSIPVGKSPTRERALVRQVALPAGSAARRGHRGGGAGRGAVAWIEYRSIRYRSHPVEGPSHRSSCRCFGIRPS